jgi:hypothetical protein
MRGVSERRTLYNDPITERIMMAKTEITVLSTIQQLRRQYHFDKPANSRQLAGMVSTYQLNALSADTTGFILDCEKGGMDYDGGYFTDFE